MPDHELDELARTRKWAHKKPLDEGSAVYRAFVRMEGAAFERGALGKKHKEFIAVGISVRADCESCMQWHIEQAALAGASYREVLEAIDVGAGFRAQSVGQLRDGHAFSEWLQSVWTESSPSHRSSCCPE